MAEDAKGKYLSKSLPDLTSVGARADDDSLDDADMLDDESISMGESHTHTDVHAYLEEQRLRLEDILCADR